MAPRNSPSDEIAGQLALFGSEPDPIVEELRGIDPNTMTPLQALETLARLVSDAQQKT
jgi:hypothetical protein